MAFASFKEKARRAYVHDFRLFVCGVEISRNVSDLKINTTNRSAPGSLEFTVQNPFDKWVMTPKNFAGQFRGGNERYSEAAKRFIYLRKKELSKKYVIKRKNPEETVGRSQQFPYPDDSVNIKSAEDFLQRYAFGPGSLIFNRFDTVKLFLKHPLDPYESDRWYPAFTGTIENKPETTNYLNGESSVSITAYDIRATMSGMRISANPFQNDFFAQQAGVGTSLVVFSDDAGFFKDWYPNLNDLQRANIGPTADNIFAQKAFVDVISMITTGMTGWVNNLTYNPAYGAGKLAGPFPSVGPGVGEFKPGHVYRYLPKKRAGTPENAKVSRTLEEWDDLCLLGTDLNGHRRTQFLTLNEVNNIGHNSFWLQAHSPLNRRVHFLIPDATLNCANMVRETFDGLKNITAPPDWVTRYELVQKICQDLDYEWSVNGDGDMLFEFPMYDFFPEDFGNNSGLYIVSQDLKDHQIADESGEVLSGLETVVSGRPDIVDDGKTNALRDGIHATFGIQKETDTALRKIAVSPILASRYGARVQQKTFFGVSDPNALLALTLFEFQKRLADCNHTSMNFDYRPFLRPNRPLLHEPRSRMGRTTNVSVSIPAYGREATISVGLNAVRTPVLIKGADGKMIRKFQTIAGGEKFPLSYNANFEPPRDQGFINSDGGITIITPATVKKQ